MPNFCSEYVELTHVPGESAIRTFIVGFATNAANAAAISDPTTGVRVPQYGESHPNDGEIQASEPSWKRIAPSGIWEATVQYGPFSLEPGEVPQGGAATFLYKYDQGELTIPWAMDADGNPLLNSASDPFDPPPEREFGFETLTVRRIEPRYDRAASRAYRRKVNSDTLTLPGGDTAEPGTVLCTSIGPEDELLPNSINCRMVYQFRIVDDPALMDGMHDWLLLDIGLRGKYNNDLGNFFDARGSLITAPVRLDGNGRPLDTAADIKVGISRGTAQLQSTPTGATKISKPGATFLKYRKYATAPLRGLGFFG